MQINNQEEVSLRLISIVNWQNGKYDDHREKHLIEKIIKKFVYYCYNYDIISKIVYKYKSV